ncbi:MAG: hypothetical protein CL868_15365 [Cytophagaceae bacterium]|nr:hypothetical protein [Cytophagaceae bacterium]|tara:strand:+ start:4118 stop:4345 length:228 start_codon:yes stop_codon:yes gene_type:complete
MTRHFTLGEVPDLDFSTARKKPIAIQCIQIHEEFTVESMEGLMHGKEDDWLMIGVTGEMYVCDNEIFIKTYDIID